MSLAATIPWGDYQKLPPDQRSRPLTDEEYSRLTPSQLEAGGLADRSEGAPADFNGPVFPNPDHIRPQLDTDPPIPATRLPRGVSFNHGVYRGGAHADTWNPPAADVIPTLGREVSATMSPQAQAMPWEEAGQQQKPAPGAMPWDEAKAVKAGSAGRTTEPGDRFAQDRAITDAWAEEHPFLGPIARFAVTAGQNAANAITQSPSQLYHAVVDPTTLDEAGLTPSQRFAYRMGGKQAIEAGEDYARGKVSPKGAVSVLPEALGTGVGQVAGGAAYAKLVPEAFDAATPNLNRIARTGAEVGKGAAKIGDVATFERAGKIANTVRNTARNVRGIRTTPETPVYPGAPLPDIPPAEVTQARVLGEGGRAVEEPSNVLGRIARPSASESVPRELPRELDATGENKPFAGGMDEYIEPKARLENTGKIPTPSETAQQIRYFRSRNVGEEGIPHANHAQATASLPEAEERIAPHREEMEGTPQEIITGNLSDAPGFSVREGPSGANWYTFHGDVPESAVSRIARPGEAEASPIRTAPGAPEIDISPKAIGRQLESALGGQELVPNVPLRDQIAAQAARSGKLPEGFTPVESSALRGYKYDPATREFQSITNAGQHYIHGDVSPEEASAFKEAESKGKAWNHLRSQNPLVAKVINGTRTAVKPIATGEEPGGTMEAIEQSLPSSRAPRFAPSEDVNAAIKSAAKKSVIGKPSAPAPIEEVDLTPEWQAELDRVKAKTAEKGGTTR